MFQLKLCKDSIKNIDILNHFTELIFETILTITGKVEEPQTGSSWYNMPMTTFRNSR